MEEGRRSGSDVEGDSSWVAIVHNDPITLMSYVVHVFRVYFGWSEAEARDSTMDVHCKGEVVVAVGSREEMERHVQALHGYGLLATLQRNP
ncbi:ATP-dependent Clp protease adapter ClpS [Streptomyces sp. NPDC005968]|uniref:ATP-dependent Clp protease adapter ClpS n=1 Tax=Streptomyces sp. NPDC005968 TaxID=3154574 RepID=UPI0033D5F268